MHYPQRDTCIECKETKRKTKRRPRVPGVQSGVTQSEGLLSCVTVAIPFTSGAQLLVCSKNV